MGGAVSSGVNNDELIDNLLEADYIRSPLIERVFRAVDRADYFVPHARGNAYKDLAWKLGNLHLSAPCIYSEVLEGLNLEPGLSFLNLGSGTGYLSTLVGLILGRTGINHGLEFYKEVVDYANAKLELFQKNSEALDEFDFCPPIFKQANCLEYTPAKKYDRVYCGASCPPTYEDQVMKLLKVGGILVMPSNDHLVQIKRTENGFERNTLIPVSFATLISPADNNSEIIEPIVSSPATLQHISRCVIRALLRTNIEKENPQIMLRNRKSTDCKAKSKRICRSNGRNDDENNLNPFLPVYCRRRGPVVVAEYWDSESESEDETEENNVENNHESVPENGQARMDCACGESSSDSSYDELDDENGKRRMKSRPDEETCARCSRKTEETARTENENSTSDSEASTAPQAPLHLYVANRYGPPMRDRIQQLPLPQILKRYLNYMRDFQ